MNAKKINKRKEYLTSEIARIETIVSNSLSKKSNGAKEINLADCQRKILELNEELSRLPSLAPCIR